MPKLVEGLDGQSVTSATAGDGFTAVATERGEVFTFGLGDRGQLGLGTTEKRVRPDLVCRLLN